MRFSGSKSSMQELNFIQRLAQSEQRGAGRFGYSIGLDHAIVDLFLDFEVARERVDHHVRAKPSHQSFFARCCSLLTLQSSAHGTLLSSATGENSPRN